MLPTVEGYLCFHLQPFVKSRDQEAFNQAFFA